jgi:hypothetical protein
MFSVLGNIQYGYLLINLRISLSYYFECLIRYCSSTVMQNLYFILYVCNFIVSFLVYIFSFIKQKLELFVGRRGLRAKVALKIFLII